MAHWMHRVMVSYFNIPVTFILSHAGKMDL